MLRRLKGQRLNVAPLLVILGPTASGKSALALSVAERVAGQILSVDSMQVYRGMDVGTAKPTADEQRRVRHHGIDLVEPDETFTVARFVELADQTIADAKRRGVPLVAAGGTPLYYKSLFEGLFEGPAADAALRERLGAEPAERLHERLKSVDPVAAERIHLNDRKRLTRALEVYELTGQPISSWQTEWSDGTPRHQAIWFGLHWDREELNRRINARTRQMMLSGWLEETRALLNRYGRLSKTASQAAGYQHLIDHLQGRLTLDEAVEQVKISTRQLARRQVKWFRRFENVTWLDGRMPVEDLLSRVLEQVDRVSAT